ncbi:MAG TPA: YeeE/YedE family protein [Burkholderiaceae bacterium]|nr:YeeE/YedE family protein [Burkholderiaceae bacterium]
MEPSAASFTTNVLWGGFGLAFLFGALANRSNFCTMGAVSDVVNMGHWNRMRMWLLAMAVAMLGATALASGGAVDLSKAVVQRPVLPWLSLLVGGTTFGIGMTLAGGCANKNLVRLGGGSIRSLVTLIVMGISAYMTLKGLFGQWRVAWLDPVSIDLAAWGWKDQGLGTALARLSGTDASTARWAAALALALPLLVFVFKDRRFRQNGLQVLAGAGIGVLVVGGWYVSGHLGYGENPDTLETVYFATNSRTIESLSFVGPVAYGLELLMLWTDKSLHPSFGIVSALGVVLGSLVTALSQRRFRWEGFASSFHDLRDHLVGAVLMGFGGVTALGCTVGQGLSGVSTLALGSFLAVAGIVGGAVATLKYQVWRAEREA